MLAGNQNKALLLGCIKIKSPLKKKLKEIKYIDIDRDIYKVPNLSILDIHVTCS